MPDLTLPDCQVTGPPRATVAPADLLRALDNYGSYPRAPGRSLTAVRSPRATLAANGINNTDLPMSAYILHAAPCFPGVAKPPGRQDFPADGLVQRSSEPVARAVDAPVPRFLVTKSAFGIPQAPDDSGDTSSPDAIHALLYAVPLAAGAD